jgi:hypothetical protein
MGNPFGSNIYCPTGSINIDPHAERKMTTVLHHGVMQQAVNKSGIV